jgi:hypothetical protein
MGWFEFYFFHLDVIETPVMIMLLHVLDGLVGRTFTIKKPFSPLASNS